MKSINYIAKSLDDVKRVVEACKETGYSSFDYETNAQPLYVESFTPTLLSITFQPGTSVGIPLDHFQRGLYTDGFDWREALDIIGKGVFQDDNIVKFAWNAKFDDQINKKYGIQHKGTLIDGMLAKYLLNEEKPNDLKSMVRMYLPDFGDYEKADSLDKLAWDRKPLVPLAKYAGLDTDCTFRLCIFLESKLIEFGLYNLFRNLYMPASRLLTDVEANGLYLDREFNKKLLEEYSNKISEAENEIRSLKRVKKFQKKYIEKRVNEYIENINRELEELDPDNPKDSRKIKTREQKIANIQAGVFTTKKEQELLRPVNFGSVKDLPALMYSEDGFGFPIIAYTQRDYHNTDQPSTSEDTLIDLRMMINNPESPKAIFLDKLLEWRGLEKMFKTYILGWNEKVQDDNCLHGRYLLHGTVTARMSCVSGDSLVKTQLGDIKIEDIPRYSDCGLLVLTREGYKPISNFIDKGLSEMYEVELEDGNKITCTLDHIFITNQGPRKLREIYNSSRNTVDKNIKLLSYCGDDEQ